MGFGDDRVRRVMDCLSSVSFAFKINGRISGSVIPSRGLRQDDIILFAKATVRECSKIAEIIIKYERASWQSVNLDKTDVVFSKSVIEERRQEIVNILGVHEVERHEKYLCLPMIIGRSKKVIFALLKERIWRKLQGWKEKLLSKPGKEVMIKAVAQAIPTYMMSIFKIPEGGMGFRDLKVFNQALLAKQIWRLHTKPNTLTHAILKAKYFKNGSVLEAYGGYDPSYSWRSLWGSKSLLLEGLKWRVGNGVNIRVWLDAWLPGEPPTAVPVHDMNFDPELRVLELINEECGEWRGDLLQSLFSVQDRNLILQLPISYAMPEDKLFWWPSKNGEYTVKSGYWLGRLGHVEGVANTLSENEREAWKLVWNLGGPPKLSHFIWKTCKGSMPVKQELHRRHMLMMRNKLVRENGTLTPVYVTTVFSRLVLDYGIYAKKGVYVSLGVVARDDRGKILLAAVRRYEGEWDVEMAEVRFGMNLARRYGFKKIWLEGDAANVATR
ncbi:uncharacterized protein LOC110688556 [Chenopodium quinoa]|uniref:uncharacterized protein LOC110688556 n=1 Tax=Chenopodium quinoa TaxID=63459 RepID=UPI000B7781E7|nr:uncharacterized protein LOC110688556 [Chenopodium quinoa]